MKVNLKRAEKLAKYLSQEELINSSDTYEKLFDFRYQVLDKTSKRNFNDLMTYEMALSMQEL